MVIFLNGATKITMSFWQCFDSGNNGAGKNDTETNEDDLNITNECGMVIFLNGATKITMPLAVFSTLLGQVGQRHVPIGDLPFCSFLGAFSYWCLSPACFTPLFGSSSLISFLPTSPLWRCGTAVTGSSQA
jgi:hypothetical protein